jgi:hypothetical protein
MVGVEFVTRRIAPLQDHRREIWRHRAGDNLRLHVSELNADAREEVIRAFFSSAAIPRTALPIYNLGARETSCVMAGILKFNAWGPFLADGIVPGPLPSAPAASSASASPSSSSVPWPKPEDAPSLGSVAPSSSSSASSLPDSSEPEVSSLEELSWAAAAGAPGRA